MARAALGWSRDRLAREANLTAKSIRAFERGAERLHINHRAAIALVLISAGIVFTADGGLRLEQISGPETGGMSR
jgi:DNA-binding XRE family transcriptional regulator